MVLKNTDSLHLLLRNQAWVFCFFLNKNVNLSLFDFLASFFLF